MKDFNGISILKNPNSPTSEALKTLRTNIQFASFDKEIKIVALTSAEPDEGKTTIAANLAISMAQIGKRTILIDCDLRNPSIHKLFGVSNSTGISDLLIGAVEIDKAIQMTGVRGLYILPAGTRPPNPAELLISLKMQDLVSKMSEDFDFVIIDTPPVLMATDAQIVSKYADGSILVIASKQTGRNDAIMAKELLEKVDAKILGVILNKVETPMKRYYRKYYGKKNK